MERPRIFMSHCPADKAFAGRLSSDLSALGAQVWLDEAELGEEDSLCERMDGWISRIDHLAIIISAGSMEARWVRDELRHAFYGRLSGRNILVLPIMVGGCEVPGFLHDKLYADFRAETLYESSLQRFAEPLGLDIQDRWGAVVRDPFAARYGRVEAYYARPQIWHCLQCGWRCDLSYDTYLCHRCEAIRPFCAPGATMCKCPSCSQWSLAIASYCEWCGERIGREV